ncbi:MAG: phospholipase D family protein [Sphingosinicella sp.]|uniref:phospholipase D family protein n=1 Tax=Sphingosinicella sp. TaxID=1917971 RepID=UPI0040376DCD
MFRLVSEGWDDVVLCARRTSPDGLRIVCPFIKERAVSRILEAGAGGVEVITRFDLNCYYDGVSDLEALEVLLDAGARIRGKRGLHSKVFLFGGASAIGTSANVTDAGMLRNHEFGFISDEAEVLAACQSYFDRLWLKSGEDLTRGRLAEWRKVVAAARRKGGGGTRSKLPDHGARGPRGPLAASARKPDEYPNQAFLKFMGTAGERAPLDLDIADMVAESGCAWACTYPTAQRPRQIEDGDLLYMARIAAPDDILIFGYATGWRHRDKEDVATKKEIDARSWKSRYKNYIRVHDAHFVDAELGVGISMAEMLSALGADAWRSTQDNARAGRGNTDPFLSYLRKPGMQLTDISRKWIDRRLQRLLRTHGEVDLTRRRFRAPS